MHQAIVNTINSTRTCKIGAIFIGIFFWSLINSLHERTITVSIPLCFYNANNTTISAPEKIQVTLSGKRSYLKTIDFKQLAAHFDASKLKPYERITISAKDLFLPRSIKLLHYYPTNLAISVQSTVQIVTSENKHS